VNGGGAGVSLAAFFGYFTKSLFDPRVRYDRTWARWVVTAEAFPESVTVQRFFIAVSKTSNAAGSYWIYKMNVDFHGNNDFFDFPQLGMDQDAVIFTANIFPAAGGFSGADLFCAAKARLYNGLPITTRLFSGLAGTLAPPIVFDQNANTFLISSPINGSSLTMYRLTNSSHPASTAIAATSTIPVTAFSAPPDARQPSACAGTSSANLLDSGDSRFVNASTQIGNFLWQTHTVANGSFPSPLFYKINTGTKSVADSGFYFAGSTSDDFNASIEANSVGDIFTTWSSTDSTNKRNADVRVGGKLGTAALGGAAITSKAIFTSLTCITGNFDSNFGKQRWGDYSQVTIDPANSKNGWAVNEDILSTSDWGSEIGSFTQ
jgi:hypothetical protein